jgi:GNAT superfamily N-acetyltransferase
MPETIQAERYPSELVRAVTLADGSPARIRPIRPDDEPGLVDLYERLSRHSAYQRFFAVRPRLPADWYHGFVEDGWQGRGLGAILLDAVMAAAEARGIRRFRAWVLADNQRMLRLLATHTRVDERTVEEGVVGLSFRRGPASG